jgi:hypothetical protein
LLSPAFADVSLLVPGGAVGEGGEGSAGQPDAGGTGEPLLHRLPAHRVVLAGASDFFRALFDGSGSARWAEAATGEVRLPDLPRAMAVRLLRYAYTGDVVASSHGGGSGAAAGAGLAHGDVSGAAELLAAACRYGMPGLAAAAETALVRDTSAATAEGILDVALSLLPATRRLATATAHFILMQYSDVAQARAAAEAGATGGGGLLARVLDYLAADAA